MEMLHRRQLPGYRLKTPKRYREENTNVSHWRQHYDTTAKEMVRQGGYATLTQNLEVDILHSVSFDLARISKNSLN